MPIIPNWNGYIYGTNTGLVSVKFDGEDESLVGVARLNDQDSGNSVYTLTGTFDGSSLQAKLAPQFVETTDQSPIITVSGRVSPKGTIEGEWQSTEGTGGTFILYPHAIQNSGVSVDVATPPARQLHTAREDFSAITVDYDEIIELSEMVQKDFANPVAITILGKTATTLFLSEFKERQRTVDIARFMQINASDPDRESVQKVVTIEFGWAHNFVTVQSADEAWAIGKAGILKQYIRQFERLRLTTNLQRLGIDLTSIFVLCGIAVVSELKSWYARIALMISLYIIAQSGNLIQRKYIPHATIYIRKQKNKIFGQIGERTLSALITIATTIVGALIIAYAKGMLHLP